MNDVLINEWELIEKAKLHPSHFEPLYKTYYEQVLKFIYSRVEELDDAYEIASSTFAKAIVGIKTYQNKGAKLSSWLIKIAINEINLFYRDTHKKRVVSIDASSAQYLAQETGSEKKELIELLHRAIQQLDEDEVQLLELRFFEERPFAEVAEILGITENNAKVKTYRIIDKLKLMFAKNS